MQGSRYDARDIRAWIQGCTGFLVYKISGFLGRGDLGMSAQFKCQFLKGHAKF